MGFFFRVGGEALTASEQDGAKARMAMAKATRDIIVATSRLGSYWKTGLVLRSDYCENDPPLALVSLSLGAKHPVSLCETFPGLK